LFHGGKGTNKREKYKINRDLFLFPSGSTFGEAKDSVNRANFQIWHKKIADCEICDSIFLFNYLLLSTLTATVTTSETANANAAMVINKKLVSNVTIINSFL
jgi:hypothetical protein